MIIFQCYKGLRSFPTLVMNRKGYFTINRSKLPIRSGLGGEGKRRRQKKRNHKIEETGLGLRIEVIKLPEH